MRLLVFIFRTYSLHMKEESSLFSPTKSTRKLLIPTESFIHHWPTHKTWRTQLMEIISFKPRKTCLGNLFLCPLQQVEIAHTLNWNHLLSDYKGSANSVVCPLAAESQNPLEKMSLLLSWFRHLFILVKPFQDLTVLMD